MSFQRVTESDQMKQQVRDDDWSVLGLELHIRRTSEVSDVFDYG